MPAGIKYELTPIISEKELCRFDTVYRMSGGFNLVLENLEMGSYLPPLAPLSIDFSTRKATVVKNVRVAEAVTAEATSIKVFKRHLAYKGMFLGNGKAGGEVSEIDKTDAKYDTITLKNAFGGTATVGSVLFESSAIGGTAVKNKANFLLYATTKVEAGASITAIGAVYEIKAIKLPAPVSDKDKETLGDRFLFV